jgi:tRNA pseudouridine32 synthase/23S rRNA pseudouridine746 synthase
MRSSRLVLPKLPSPPATILEHLFERFPRIPADTWRARVTRGLVHLSDGTTVTEASPYRHGITVFYRKEVESEPMLLEDARIIWRDDNIMVVDKPHGMPVTPVGNYVDRSLLVRLEKTTGLPELTPLHRLDRETAGVLLLAINPEVRAAYHQLFADGLIERQYLAAASVGQMPEGRCWHVENRMGSGQPWFRQRIVDGPPNAVTDIELLEVRDGIGLFRLLPKTGKKHQLRVHMMSIGFPIIGDPFYPELREKRDEDTPLQLVADQLAFVDPITKVRRMFRTAFPLPLGEGSLYLRPMFVIASPFGFSNHTREVSK